jgi:hypothetical protein
VFILREKNIIEIFFSRTSNPALMKVGTTHFCMQGIPFQINGQVLFEGAIIAKVQK